MDLSNSRPAQGAERVEYIATVHAKALSAAFCTIISRHPVGIPEASQEVHRIVAMLPSGARESTSAATLHAICEGAEWLADHAGEIEVTSMVGVTDMWPVMMPWQTFSPVWLDLPEGSTLRRSGGLPAKNQDVWRRLVAVARRVAVLFERTALNHKGEHARLMSIARAVARDFEEGRS